jgi:DNA replication initiation complex subunit (GINS family)
VELWGNGAMDEKLTYDYIWQAYQKEKQTNQLLLIPRTFYQDTSEFLKLVKVKKDNEPSIENTTRLINDFFEKRKQKILIYIAYNKQLPQPISSNEIEFYNKVLQIVKSERLDHSNQNSNTNTLKSIKDIPEIILPSGNKIGPLKKDQTVKTENEQDNIYLTENMICEKIY